jgi:hypothetical protein
MRSKFGMNGLLKANVEKDAWELLPRRRTGLLGRSGS